MPTIKKEFGGIIFEWDNDKAQLNANQHGVSFDEALTVLLYDDNALTNEDPGIMMVNSVLSHLA